MPRPRDGGCPLVTLVDVDEPTLDRLVAAAVSGAAPDDVTPPVTVGEDWSEGRIAWLRDFHQARRRGLDGPAGEATWAIVIDGAVVGSARLKRTPDAGILETGIWLTRPTRGRGIARGAMTDVVERATRLGAAGLRADTTAANEAALSVLRHLGFGLGDDGAGAVSALLLF